MKRKATFQKQGTGKKAKTTGAAAQVKAGASLTDELKYNDVAFATDATTTATVVDLNNFAAGDTVNLRDGNKVSMRSLELRVALELEAITQNATCRFVVVVDKNANAAAPTFSGSVVTSVFDAATPAALRQISTMSRFTILMDKTFVINQSASNAGGVQKFFFKKYIKIAPFLQLASWGSNAAGVPLSNSLSLLYISDVAAGVADVNVAGQARLRFVG